MNLAPINSTEVAQIPLPLHPTIDEQEAFLAQLCSARVHAENLRPETARIRTAAWSDLLNAVFL